MIVRPALAEDALPIARIHVRTWKEAYRGIVPAAYLSGLSVEQRQQGWLSALAAGHPRVWVADDGGEILGWVAQPPPETTTPGPQSERFGIYVAPEHWRKGVGQLLCGAAERHLAEAGFNYATLWVLADNVRALDFYRSKGFVVDNAENGKKQADFAGEALLEIRMRKSLCN